MSKTYCPSCWVHWKTPEGDDSQTFHLLCSFCSLSPSEEKLLDYQMDNLELIEIKDYPKLMRRLYRLIMKERDVRK